MTNFALSATYLSLSLSVCPFHFFVKNNGKDTEIEWGTLYNVNNYMNSSLCHLSVHPSLITVSPLSFYLLPIYLSISLLIPLLTLSLSLLCMKTLTSQYKIYTYLKIRHNQQLKQNFSSHNFHYMESKFTVASNKDKQKYIRL